MFSVDLYRLYRTVIDCVRKVQNIYIIDKSQICKMVFGETIPAKFIDVWQVYNNISQPDKVVLGSTFFGFFQSFHNF